MARPTFHPQLATLVSAPPAGDTWIHEIKYDGYRIGAVLRDGHVTLLTRNGHDWTSVFPEIVAALHALPVGHATLDGEIAALMPDGRTSFQALQTAIRDRRTARLVYVVFDLLALDGHALTAAPLVDRKAHLHALLASRTPGPVREADYIVGHGRRCFEHAQRLGLEGIVSKRRDAPYVPGGHGDWLKAKCHHRQEFVIGGYTHPTGARSGIGALLIGVREGAALRYCGRVGTGFTRKTAAELEARLERLARKTSPFDPPPATSERRGARWVSPTLVCEVAFTEWTGDGRIRHPSFKGLRDDTPSARVVREVASTPPVPASPPPPPPLSPPSPTPRLAGITITHPERVVYPVNGLTKLQVAQYLQDAGPWLLPHLVDRPLTLVRCPRGLSHPCHFMKHSMPSAPEALRRVVIAESGGPQTFLVVDDAAGTAALGQMGVLEIHGWNARAADIEHPDRLVFDLDPGDRVPWATVCDTARLVRAALEALDLESFVKTTGGNGLHVVVPLVPAADWDACLGFVRTLAGHLERADPRRLTTGFRKAGRADKILLDYVRNSRGSTSISPYSMRARPSGGVSTPITWEELGTVERGDQFTLGTMGSRLASLRRDPWHGFLRHRQRLTPTRCRAVSDVRLR